MELRRYWAIVLHRAWIPVVLLIVVLGSYLALAPAPTVSYNAGMRFVVGIQPEQQGDYYAYDRYYTWLTAEYLVDDLSEVVKSRAFAADVAEISGVAVGPGAIQGATSSGKLHRVLSVSIAWHNEQELARIADAVVTILTTHADRYFAQLSTDAAVISVIDPPAISPIGQSLRSRLDLPLRLVLALAAGIGLAFLLDYLDASVRHGQDLGALGLPILGVIPVRRGILARLPWRRLP